MLFFSCLVVVDVLLLVAAVSFVSVFFVCSVVDCLLLAFFVYFWVLWLIRFSLMVDVNALCHLIMCFVVFIGVWHHLLRLLIICCCLFAFSVLIVVCHLLYA